MSRTINCRPKSRCLSLPMGNQRSNRNPPYLTVLDSISEIPTPLRPNAIYFVKDGLYFDIIQVNNAGTSFFTHAIMSQNIEVESLTEGQIITHNLKSTRIEVSFFQSVGGRPVREIDYEVIDQDSFKVYLPILESGGLDFIGDIYIKKRQ